MDRAPVSIRMYYNLLRIKADDKAYLTHHSDKEIKQIIDYYEQDGDKSLLPEAYYYGGRVYADMNDAPRALGFFQKAKDAMKDKLDSSLICTIYSQMGYLFMFQNLYNEALLAFEKSYQYSVLMKDTVSAIYDLRDIASAYTEKGEDALSLHKLLSARKSALKIKDTMMIASVESYIATQYCAMGKYNLAKKYIQSPLRIVTGPDKFAIIANAADICALSGDKDSAMYYFSKVKDSGSLYAKEAAYKFFTQQAIERAGNKKALILYKIYNSYKDSVRLANSTEALAKANSLYNYQLREIENMQLEKANAKMWASLTISILAILVLLSVLGLLFQYHRHRRAAMRIQMERLKQINESIHRKSKKYVDDNKRRISELEQQLDTAGKENKELRTKLENEKSKLVSENEIAEIANIEHEQAFSQVVSTDVYHRFYGLLSADPVKNPNEDDWNELERVVNAAYEGFTDRLASICRLSRHEKRVCLLIKMNVPPSKIALLTNHTETSVSATRRRLYEKYFGKKDAPKAWDDFILSM